MWLLQETSCLEWREEKLWKLVPNERLVSKTIQNPHQHFWLQIRQNFLFLNINLPKFLHMGGKAERVFRVLKCLSGSGLRGWPTFACYTDFMLSVHMFVENHSSWNASKLFYVTSYIERNCFSQLCSTFVVYHAAVVNRAQPHCKMDQDKSTRMLNLIKNARENEAGRV